MDHRELLLLYAEDIREEALRVVRRKKEGDSRKTKIIEYFWEVWKEDMMAPAGTPRRRVSLQNLLKKIKREEFEKENVTTELSRVRDDFKSAKLVKNEGTFSFKLSDSPYMLDVSLKPDPSYSIKKFWSPYQDCTREQPVLIGVLQRLFFLLKDESSDDEVYLRSRLVNLEQQYELQHSPILASILAGYPPSEYTRQYVSSGDAAGAFTLLQCFNDIEVQALGIRLPDNRTQSSSSIILGSGLNDKVLIPGFPDDFQFSTSSRGIDDKTTKHNFKDEWKTEQPHIFALLSRWPINKNKNFCTTIHANSAAAIDGVCLALAFEPSVEALLAKKEIGLKGQLIFKVGLTRGTFLSANSVSVWTEEEPFFSIWP